MDADVRPHEQLFAVEKLQLLHMRLKDDFDPTTPEAKAAWQESQKAGATA
jgi:hypothetical protein